MKGYYARIAMLSLAVCAAAVLLSGCTTKVKDVDANAWAKDFYVNQPNNTLVQEVTGTNVSWTITGATRIAFYAPIPAKNMIPRDTSWMDSLGAIIGDVAPWIAMGYMSGNLQGTAGGTTLRGATTISAPAATPATTTP